MPAGASPGTIQPASGKSGHLSGPYPLRFSSDSARQGPTVAVQPPPRPATPHPCILLFLQRHPQGIHQPQFPRRDRKDSPKLRPPPLPIPHRQPPLSTGQPYVRLWKAARRRRDDLEAAVRNPGDTALGLMAPTGSGTSGGSASGIRGCLPWKTDGGARGPLWPSEARRSDCSRI